MKHYKIINNSEISQFGCGINNYLNVLTYNVCWEAMKSSATFGFELCVNFKLSDNPICKSNIINNITLCVKKYNPELLAFQESIKYKEIIETLDNSTYEYYVNKSGLEYMLTMWNCKIYTTVNCYNYEFEEGRPFAIIILKHKSSDNHIAFINLHSGHKINTQTSIFNIINNYIKDNIDLQIKKLITRVIMAGDFNRVISQDVSSDYIIIFEKKFKLYHSSNIKPTCCDLLHEHTKNYDYVLDSKAKPIKKYLGIEMPDYIVPASDHVLIVEKLKY